MASSVPPRQTLDAQSEADCSFRNSVLGGGHGVLRSSRTAGVPGLSILPLWASIGSLTQREE